VKKVSRNSFWVFDLDDTLYFEADYHRSGLNVVAEHVLKLFGHDFSKEASSFTPKQDFLGFIIKKLGLPDEVKKSLLWLYRSHYPEITPKTGAIKLLKWINQHSNGVAILTDGRSISQRNKVHALGISAFPLYVSEEWGEVKPGLLRYQHIEKTFNSDEYIYVGDNPKKDFLAPNQLGWNSIMIKDCGRNIHTQNVEVTEEYMPNKVVENIEDIRELLC
jgi:putative hydrolase of the HAD superfamily